MILVILENGPVVEHESVPIHVPQNISSMQRELRTAVGVSLSQITFSFMRFYVDFSLLALSPETLRWAKYPLDARSSRLPCINPSKCWLYNQRENLHYYSPFNPVISAEEGSFQQPLLVIISLTTTTMTIITCFTVITDILILKSGWEGKNYHLFSKPKVYIIVKWKLKNSLFKFYMVSLLSNY